MQAILQAAQQQQATDILSIDNRIWFRVLGSLKATDYPVVPFVDIPSGFELKSPTHIRCLPLDLTLTSLQYPSEVSTVTDFTKGLVILSGTNNSGKTTLLLHWLSRLKNRSVDSHISLPATKGVLWSSDQPDIQIVTVTDSESAFNALRNSIHRLVIAIIDARSNADALRHLTMILKDHEVHSVQSLMSEQISSLVNINLVRTVQQKLRPLIAITNRNESIAALIADGKYQKLEDAVQRGNGGRGSLSADVQLAEWIQMRQIQLDEAIRFANYPATMRLRASGIIHND